MADLPNTIDVRIEVDTDEFLYRLAEATRAARDFEASMRRVRHAVGMGEEEIRNLTDKLREMADDG